MNTTTTYQKNTENLENVLSVMLDADFELTVFRAKVFLAVVRLTRNGDAVRLVKLEEVLGVPQPTVSKNIMGLTARGVNGKSGKPGLDFVKTYDDPDDMRHRLVALTDAGRKFANKLVKAME